MPLQRKLSTLEQTALGIIFKRGPCKAYAVMSEFAGSQNSAYSSGAGSVYPMLRRLETAGLIKTAASGEHRLYTLTSDGLRALRGWFDLASDDDSISCCLDELRSRTYFLKVMEPTERQQFLDVALTRLTRLLADCRKTMIQYRESGDAFSEMAMKGAVMETQARIRWVRMMLYDES
jgi:DNA-binding PadR family transcriptional regulator